MYYKMLWNIIDGGWNVQILEVLLSKCVMLMIELGIVLVYIDIVSTCELRPRIIRNHYWMRIVVLMIDSGHVIVLIDVILTCERCNAISKDSFLVVYLSAM